VVTLLTLRVFLDRAFLVSWPAYMSKHI
jgi:hypothetical protein